jgi:hypothetical protein
VGGWWQAVGEGLPAGDRGHGLVADGGDRGLLAGDRGHGLVADSEGPGLLAIGGVGWWRAVGGGGLPAPRITEWRSTFPQKFTGAP